MISRVIQAPSARVAPSPLSRLAVAVRSLPPSAYLWIALWFGINTGPWVFESNPDSAIGWAHLIRAVFPFIVLVIAIAAMMNRGLHEGMKLPGPVRLWFAYGLVGLTATLLSPEPGRAFYWAVAYLAAFVVIKAHLTQRDAVARALQLNYLSGIIPTLFLLILVLVSWDALLVESQFGRTGYGIVSRVQTVAGMPMSRSSGIARFAAVPGLIALIYVVSAKGWKRVLWAVPLLASGALIYFMQSRGSMLAFAAATAFAAILLTLRSRREGLAVLALALVVLVVFWSTSQDAEEEEALQRLSAHLTRNQEWSELQGMAGRPVVWSEGLEEVWNSPILGWGFQADRYILGAHIHNSYIYALLTGGVIGGLLFACGILWTWWLFARALKRVGSLADGQRILLFQCGSILAFFTVRGIPEVCGSMYGVDFMVMLPMLTYIGLIGGGPEGPRRPVHPVVKRARRNPYEIMHSYRPRTGR